MSGLSIEDLVTEISAASQLSCCGSANLFRGIVVGDFRRSQVLLKSYLELPPIIPGPNPVYVLEVLEELKIVEEATIEALNKLASGKCNPLCCLEASHTLASIANFENTIVRGALGLEDPEVFQTGLKVIRSSLLNSISFVEQVACCDFDKCKQSCGEKSCCSAVVAAVGSFYRNLDATAFTTLTLVEAAGEIIKILLGLLYALFKRQCCCNGSAQGLTILANASLDSIVDPLQAAESVIQFGRDAKALVCDTKC